MADLIPKKQKEVVEFRKSHGSKVIGEVMVDQVITYYDIKSFFIQGLTIKHASIKIQ